MTKTEQLWIDKVQVFMNRKGISFHYLSKSVDYTSSQQLRKYIERGEGNIQFRLVGRINDFMENYHYEVKK